jgi:predicted 2-oxoglutarate/Fe(II)-dependent dioxygenase YbiX
MQKTSAANYADYTEEVKGIFSLQLYDIESCQKLIAEVKACRRWGAAEVSVEEEARYGSQVEEETRRASVLDTSLCSGIVRGFNRKVNRVIKPLVKQLWSVALPRHTGTHLVRYTEGNFYAPHTDAALDVSDRYFTVLCYLNHDFAGGQTSFPHLGHAVEPRAGKAVIFPATYLHSSEPVMKGQKFVLVTWLVGSKLVSWI